MYTINSFITYSEIDDFENGCLPDTTASSAFDYAIRGETTDDIIQGIKDWLSVDDDAIELNACDEPGRIDISRMERNADSCIALDSDIESWKQGNTELRYVVYTGYLEQVTSAKF